MSTLGTVVAGRQLQSFRHSGYGWSLIRRIVFVAWRCSSSVRSTTVTHICIHTYYRRHRRHAQISLYKFNFGVCECVRECVCVCVVLGESRVVKVLMQTDIFTKITPKLFNKSHYTTYDYPTERLMLWKISNWKIGIVEKKKQLEDLNCEKQINQIEGWNCKRGI